MSAAHDAEGRGWILVLAAMVVVTVGAVVGYLLAPYDPPPNERADTGAPGVVAPEHRIVALRADGSLVLLDDRTGEVSEVVRSAVEGSVAGLETTAGKEAAYVTLDDGSIDLVRLKTGEQKGHDHGRSATIGPIAFPQLPRTVSRPGAEQLAFVTEGEGGDAVTVENLTTGSERMIDAATDMTTIDDLVLSPFDNRLFGVARQGRTVFRVDADRVESLDQAETADAPDDVGRYVDNTPHADGLAAIVERPDGSTDVVEVDPDTLRPMGVLLDEAPDGDRFRTIDADERAVSFLLVTDHDRLLRFAPGEEPEELAGGVARAVW